MEEGKASDNNALECLLLLCSYFHKTADKAVLEHEHDVDGRGLDGRGLVLAARKLGFRSKLRKLDWDRMLYQSTPCICLAKDGRWVILARFGVMPGRDRNVGLLHWADSSQETLDIDSLRDKLSGEVVSLTPREGNPEDNIPFNLAWFVPSLVKHRWRVAEILLASLLVNLLGLAAPISFQVVMDKVLVHRAYETLVTVAVGFGFAVMMETLLGTLRGYFTAHLGCRLDVHLGERVFRKLVGQPLQYFRSRQVGEIVQRLRELDSVRSFLVNGVVNVTLDLVFIVVYLWVMWYYSEKLTLIMLGSLVAFGVVAFFYGPVIRRRVKRQYERAAANQAFLVETVKAIQTVKASAVEPQKRRSWENKLSDHSVTSFDAAMAGNYGSNTIQLISRVTTVLLLGYGALEVIDGNMSVGSLIAFNMLAQRVTQPVLRMSQLWQELQEMRVSLQRVSDLMDSPTEQTGAGVTPASDLRGEIVFDKVGFRYPNRERDVLRDVDLRVEPGQVVGIIGSSGSGKSTLVSLLQRFYQTTSGRILVDGQNIDELRLPWLRGKLGVVLQDNELFNGTVQDNIAYANPAMPIETVVAAAKLACADEFIRDELVRGYQTEVGEGGALLSGGQRQRVAIARALANDPRLLILDEATSALDSESAAKFIANLPQICAGRTVFLITHNLSMLVHCATVVVMEHGQIVEKGLPDELLAKGGRFAKLHETGKL